MGKPAFDPSKAFDLPQSTGSTQTAPQMAQSAGAKPAFDPSKPFDTPQPTQKPSMITSAGRNLVQGATAGWSDELSGGIDAVGRAAGIDGLGSRPVKDISMNPDGPTLDTDKLKAAYQMGRDHERASLVQDKAENPKISGAANLVGGVVSPINKVLPSGNLVASGAMLGGLNSAGSSDSDTLGGLAKDTAIGTAGGAVLGKVLPAVVSKVSPVIQTGAQKISGKLGDLAEQFAVNSTGATGLQASKFEDGAGRELLDRGIVKFGDNQAKIAGRASDAVDQANKQIDQSLTKLDAGGVKVDGNAIYNTIKDKITSMKGDPSKADIVKNLEGELDNLLSSTDAKGSAEFGMKEAEDIKRGYNRKAGNWADPEKSAAGKEMYQTYRGAVEDAAQKADPTTAAAFQEGKKSYGLLAPIQEAAERRASTTGQSPVGGLADSTAAIGGFIKGGPVGAVVAPIGRRLLAPRTASSLAVVSDQVSKALMHSPTMQELATSNPQAFQNVVTRFATKFENSAAPAFQNAASNTPNELDTDSSKSAQYQVPTKGEAKWAQDGISKLSQHDPSMQIDQSALSDPKLKDLVIQASDLKPGSKAMDAVQAKIKSQMAKVNN